MRHAHHDTFCASLTTLSRAEKIDLAKIVYALALKEIAAGKAVDPRNWRAASDMRKQFERLDVDA
jgi:hypothetical protein